MRRRSLSGVASGLPASRYAARFCAGLQQRLARSRAVAAEGHESEVLAELRRFYRLTSPRKRAHIERGA